ncbi:MAG: dihydropteroate synthase [Bacteroidota bacterium]
MEANKFHSLNCRGKLLALDQPRIMGILNLTPDSFSDGGRYNTLKDAVEHAGKMLQEGADIIDIGGYSSRPYAKDISPEDELARVRDVTVELLGLYPAAIFSIDTFRASVAQPLLEMGVHMVNDISAGKLDPGMMEMVASYQDAPYIMMHMQGRPQNMQDNPQYDHVVEEVWAYFVERINAARAAGLGDLVLDLGYGFGKQLAHNYQLFTNLPTFARFNLPMLVGVSRKSMLFRLFDTHPEDVLELASVLHYKGMEMGARIFRVHDVKEAVRVRTLFQYIKEHGAV